LYKLAQYALLIKRELFSHWRQIDNQHVWSINVWCNIMWIFWI